MCASNDPCNRYCGIRIKVAQRAALCCVGEKFKVSSRPFKVMDISSLHQSGGAATSAIHAASLA